MKAVKIIILVALVLGLVIVSVGKLKSKDESVLPEGPAGMLPAKNTKTEPEAAAFQGDTGAKKTLSVKVPEKVGQSFNNLVADFMQSYNQHHESKLLPVTANKGTDSEHISGYQRRKIEPLFKHIMPDPQKPDTFRGLARFAQLVATGQTKEKTLKAPFKNLRGRILIRYVYKKGTWQYDNAEIKMKSLMKLVRPIDLKDFHPGADTTAE